MNPIKHQINFINWSKEATYLTVNNQQMAQVYEFIKKHRKPILMKTKTDRGVFTNKTYKLAKNRHYMTIYLYSSITNEWFTAGYNVITTNWLADDKNDKERKTRNSILLVKKKFEELNPDISMRRAFGMTNSKFKRCIPKSIFYTNPAYMNRIIDCVSSVDFTSQYPANICGRLPNSKTSITFNGRVEPTEEYPFAFYLGSGHVAEYGVFDTHNWTLSPLFQYLFRFDDTNHDGFKIIKESEEYTVLMKASDYELTDVYQYYFKLRHANEDAKAVMNQSIGWMHTNKYEEYKYAHLAAIAIARSNHKILKLIEKIKITWVVQIAVDGVIYIGDEVYGSDEKELGVLYQEITGAKFKIVALNRYMFKRGKEILKCKHAAVNYWRDGGKIEDKDIKDFNDLNRMEKRDLLKEMKLDYEENL